MLRQLGYFATMLAAGLLIAGLWSARDARADEPLKKKIDRSAQTAKHNTSKFVGWSGDKIKKGAKATGHGARKVAKAVVRTAKKGAKKTREAFSSEKDGKGNPAGSASAARNSEVAAN